MQLFTYRDLISFVFWARMCPRRAAPKSSPTLLTNPPHNSQTNPTQATPPASSPGAWKTSPRSPSFLPYRLLRNTICTMARGPRPCCDAGRLRACARTGGSSPRTFRHSLRGWWTDDHPGPVSSVPSGCLGWANNSLRPRVSCAVFLSWVCPVPRLPSASVLGRVGYRSGMRFYACDV